MRKPSMSVEDLTSYIENNFDACVKFFTKQPRQFSSVKFHSIIYYGKGSYFILVFDDPEFEKALDIYPFTKESLIRELVDDLVGQPFLFSEDVLTSMKQYVNMMAFKTRLIDESK